jgi:hypothetical protein
MDNEIMRTKEIQTKFDAAFTELLNLLSSFDREQFNIKPGEEKWSAGQVAGHLIKANSGFTKLLKGADAVTERKPDGKIAQIEADFSNFERKMTAPDFLMPDEKIYERENSIDSFERIKSEIDDAVHTEDLTKTRTAFEFPADGFLTGLETLSFVKAHIKRHNFQLKRIRERI